MYGSLSEADTYFENDLSGTWDNYSDAQKTKALNKATEQIDRLKFAGEKYEIAPTQTLQFPRVLYTVNETIYYDENLSTGDIEVPADVEYATYMQAKHLLDTTLGGDETGNWVKKGITSMSILSTSESYDKSLSPVDVKSGVYRESMQLLEKYLVFGW